MIKCLYTCNRCQVIDAVIYFRVRYDDEDVCNWVNDLAVVMYNNHRLKFPSCDALLDLKIPIGNEKGIGYVPKH